ncbi:MAG: DUF2318 domain-containing protein [Thermoleophilia bacterium]|nr:DUF2318 domain-containing protein [Thermoleophilia bacterium]
MLETLVLELRPAAAVATLAAAAAYLFPALSTRALVAGTAAGFAASGLLAFLVETRAAPRESVDGAAALLATLGLLVLGGLWYAARRRRGSGRAAWAIPAGLCLAILPWGTDLLLRTLRTWTQADPLQGPPWSALAGILAAVLTALLLAVMLTRARTVEAELAGGTGQAHEMDQDPGAGRMAGDPGAGHPTAGAGVLLLLAVLLAQQLLMLLQIGLANGYLPLTPDTLAVAAPLLNARPWLFYLLPAGWLLVIGFRMRGGQRGAGASAELQPFRNPAEARLVRAYGRRYRRLILAAAGGAVLMLTLVAGHELLQGSAGAVVLSPGKPVSAQDGVVTISTDELPPGELVRFSYQAGDGTEVRFLALNKGSGVFGVALDACAICGPTGYSQQDEDLICRACGVRINVPTVGFPGGCNPIPLDVASVDGGLRIDAAELESQTRKFW